MYVSDDGYPYMRHNASTSLMERPVFQDIYERSLEVMTRFEPPPKVLYEPTPGTPKCKAEDAEADKKEDADDASGNEKEKSPVKSEEEEEAKPVFSHALRLRVARARLNKQ